MDHDAHVQAYEQYEASLIERAYWFWLDLVEHSESEDFPF